MATLRDLSERKPKKPAPAVDGLGEVVRALQSMGGAANALLGQDMLHAGDFAQLLGISLKKLDALHISGEVLGLETVEGETLYPMWQLDKNHQVLSGMNEVINAFSKEAWSVYRFLTRPLDLLGGDAPLDLLRRGEADRVADLAHSAARGDHL